jgi:recombination protein RecT
MSNAPQNQNQGQVKPVDRLKSIVNQPSVQEQFRNAMGDNAGLFTASLIDVYMGDTNLQQCDPNAVVMEALKAATLKLPINKNLGLAYIVPYKHKGQQQPQMQIGYRGYIQLAQRTGQYRIINADAVYEGELNGHDKLTGEIDLNGTATSDTVVGYFAYIETTSGFKKISYWTKNEVIQHAQKHSKSYNSQYSPWQTNFHAMAVKTVLKHLLSKYGVMSVELVNALEQESEDQVFQDEAANANQDVIDVDPPMNASEDGETPGDPELEPQPETADATADEPGF